MINFQASDSGLPRLSSSIQIQVSIRPGVETGLLIDKSLLKGGATIALIAILVSTIFIFVLVFLAVVFVCRHKKVRKAPYHLVGGLKTRLTLRFSKVLSFVDLHDKRLSWLRF